MPKLLSVDVVRPSGLACPLKIDPQTTAGMLKHKLAELWNCPPECQTLLFKSQSLNDGMTLSSLSRCRTEGISVTCVISVEPVYSNLDGLAVPVQKKRNALTALAVVANLDYERAINTHMRYLRAEDRILREISVEGLVRMASDGGNEVKAEVLDMANVGINDQDDACVRSCSVEVVGRVASVGDEESTARLIQLQADSCYEVRAAVVTALSKIIPEQGGPAAAVLNCLASDENHFVREAAAVALGQMMLSRNAAAGDVATLTVLAEDKSRFVRAAAAASFALARAPPCNNIPRE